MPAQEKTEQATPKRKRDERKKGNVFQSREIGAVVGLLAVFFTLQIMGPLIINTLTGGIERFWSMAGSAKSMVFDDTGKLFLQGVGMYAVSALPALLVAGLVAIILTLGQTRGLFAAKSFSPKFSRLNPAQGLKKIISLKGIIELVKSLLKIVILAYVIYSKYMEHIPELPRLMQVPFRNVLFYAAGFLMDIVTNTAVIFVFLAAGDYMFQRWQYEKDLRMTKQEIKEEYKQTEGDPQIKAKIREKQRQMSQSRMMANVPSADVIVRNPTHYAVAIRYNAEENAAPVVLAKGADLLALRIIRVAEENDILAVENRPLARSLYETVPLDREIPEEYFQPVAEILAFVYSTQKKKMAKALRKKT